PPRPAECPRKRGRWRPLPRRDSRCPSPRLDFPPCGPTAPVVRLGPTDDIPTERRQTPAPHAPRRGLPRRDLSEDASGPHIEGKASGRRRVGDQGDDLKQCQSDADDTDRDSKPTPSPDEAEDEEDHS